MVLILIRIKNNKAKYHISVYFNSSQETIHSLCNNSSNLIINFTNMLLM